MTQVLPSAGIDLIEFTKARSFYRSHKDNLGPYFVPGEISFIRKSRRPHESLALVLAAKEAVFKSLGFSWMGPSGFKNIRIRHGKKLSFELSGPFSKVKKYPRNLFFAKHKRYVVVGCLPASA